MVVDLAIELLKELKDEKVVNHLYSGANVMEEVGLTRRTSFSKYD